MSDINTFNCILSPSYIIPSGIPSILAVTVPSDADTDNGVIKTFKTIISENKKPNIFLLVTLIFFLFLLNTINLSCKTIGIILLSLSLLLSILYNSNTWHILHSYLHFLRYLAHGLWNCTAISSHSPDQYSHDRDKGSHLKTSWQPRDPLLQIPSCLF